MSSLKVHWVVGFKQKQWLSEEVFQNIIHIQAYNWTKYALFEITLSGGLQAEAIAFRRNFLKHYTHSNIRLNKICAPWKYTELWSRSKHDTQNGFRQVFQNILHIQTYIEQSMRSVNVQWVVGLKQKQGLQKTFFKTLITFKHTIEQNVRSVEVHWVVGLLSEEAFQKAEAKYALSAGLQQKQTFFKITFKHTIEQNVRSVEVHWVVGFKQNQLLSEEAFQNNIHFQTYSWTKYALSENTVSDGLQPEAIAFRRNFFFQIYDWTKKKWVGLQQKHDSQKKFFKIHIQTYNWTKYALSQSTLSRWAWASSRSNGFQSKFFETLYTFEHTIEQSMRSLKLRWVVGFKQKQ